MKKAADLWKERTNLSNVPSIQWGVENEDNAREDYQQLSGNEVTKCGLFISRSHPSIGASPDGIVQEKTKVVEIRCHPTDLSKLTSKQRSSFCSTKRDGVGDSDGDGDGDGDGLILKKIDAYFSQIQAQMFVSGFKSADFII